MNVERLGFRFRVSCQWQPLRNRAKLAVIAALAFGLASTANFAEGHPPFGMMFGGVAFLYGSLAYKFFRAAGKG